MDCGLNVEEYSEEFDLVRSGKLHEVIYHATKRVGNPIVTVKDLKEFLE